MFSIFPKCKRIIYISGLLLEKHQENMNVSCLPTLQISDVQRELERTKLQFTSVSK